MKRLGSGFLRLEPEQILVKAFFSRVIIRFGELIALQVTGIHFSDPE